MSITDRVDDVDITEALAEHYRAELQVASRQCYWLTDVTARLVDDDDIIRDEATWGYLSFRDKEQAITRFAHSLATGETGWNQVCPTAALIQRVIFYQRDDRGWLAWRAEVNR